MKSKTCPPGIDDVHLPREVALPLFISSKQSLVWITIIPRLGIIRQNGWEFLDKAKSSCNLFSTDSPWHQCKFSVFSCGLCFFEDHCISMRSHSSIWEEMKPPITKFIPGKLVGLWRPNGGHCCRRFGQKEEEGWYQQRFRKSVEERRKPSDRQIFLHSSFALSPLIHVQYSTSMLQP